MFAMSDTKKIGTGLLFLGVLFLFLGVMLFFDRGLLALGNILFLTGFAFLSGPMRTYEFFMRRKMWRGSACFLGGIMLVMLGYVITGMALEVWGFLNLFASFLRCWWRRPWRRTRLRPGATRPRMLRSGTARRRRGRRARATPPPRALRP